MYLLPDLLYKAKCKKTGEWTVFDATDVNCDGQVLQGESLVEIDFNTVCTSIQEKYDVYGNQIFLNDILGSAVDREGIGYVRYNAAISKFCLYMFNDIPMLDWDIGQPIARAEPLIIGNIFDCHIMRAVSKQVTGHTYGVQIKQKGDEYYLSGDKIMPPNIEVKMDGGYRYFALTALLESRLNKKGFFPKDYNYD